MAHLLNLLAAVALLVWGTSQVRAGMFEVFGAKLRYGLAHGLATRPRAALAGFGVTALVQSSTATALIVSAFAGQGLVALPAALAVMLGADVGTGLMAVVFSFDLSWLSPLLVLLGVVLCMRKTPGRAGQVGRMVLALGLMLLALKLVSQSAAVMAQSGVVRELLRSLASDLLLQLTFGAALVVLAWSSLAIVLLAGALAGAGTLPVEVAIGVVLGANIGGGLLAVLATSKAAPEVRQVPAGNLVFKLAGVALAAPFVDAASALLHGLVPGAGGAVVAFHLAFNLMLAILFLGFTPVLARWLERWLPRAADAPSLLQRPQHLDPAALGTPSRAIANAAREALHQADVVETMMVGLLAVLKDDDLQRARELRRLDDTVDALHASIKGYLTRISREGLGEAESRRWSGIIDFTINLEQAGDITERMLLDVEEKKIRAGRSFSAAGLAEICALHALLIDNLRLGMSVFLHGSVDDARRLVEAKRRFRELERTYAANHLDRLAGNTVQSIETSSLHLDLISALKRVNSHICAVAYPVLQPR